MAISPIDYTGGNGFAQGVGLAGLYQETKQRQALADQQQQQLEAEKAFQADWNEAWNSGDQRKIMDLTGKYPSQMKAIRDGIGIRDEQHQKAVNDMANDLAVARQVGTPQAIAQAISKHQNTLKGIATPEETMQMALSNPAGFDNLVNAVRLSTMPADQQFDVRDKQEGRAETARHNLASEANTREGNALSYKSAMTGHSIAAQRLQLDREIRIAETQEKVLDRKLQREKNELEREKLQQQIGEAREKSAAAKNEKLNSVIGSFDDLNAALNVGKELKGHVNEHSTVVSRNQGGFLGMFPNWTDDTKTLAAKTDEYNLKVVLPALRGTFGGNPTEGERTALMQSQNNLKNATSQEDYLRELDKSQNIIIGMQKRQVKSLGIPVTKSNDESTDVKMLISDPSLVGEYIKTYGYLPDEYYKYQLGGK